MNNSVQHHDAGFVEKVAFGIAGISQTLKAVQESQDLYAGSTLGVSAAFLQEAKNDPAAAAFVNVVQRSMQQIKEMNGAAVEPHGKVAMQTAVVAPIRGELNRKPTFSRFDA